jgi:hypothetical protein
MQYLHEAYQKQLDAMQETNNQQMAAMLSPRLMDAAWPVDDGWRSAPASRIVLLAWGATTANWVWVGVVATALATAVSSWT